MTTLLMESFRFIQVLRMHQSLSSDPRYASVLLGPNKDGKKLDGNQTRESVKWSAHRTNCNLGFLVLSWNT